ncbi:MAG TPA: peptidylprolyl isomerase, partial [Spirochaetia bacterium]|nr:peptidylprolyl isomerase [Spirochaetia bacterium]
IAVDIRNLNPTQKDAARTKIDSLYRQIRTGQATFDDLVRKSVDDPSYTGGDFGYLVRNDPRTVNILGQAFIDSVFTLKQNEVSGVLPSNVAYYIAQITDKRPPKLLTLDDPILPGAKITVRDRITQYLMAQTQQKAFADAANTLIASLRKKADIQLFEANLNW